MSHEPKDKVSIAAFFPDLEKKSLSRENFFVSIVVSQKPLPEYFDTSSVESVSCL
jgi:hypothetical protein